MLVKCERLAESAGLATAPVLSSVGRENARQALRPGGGCCLFFRRWNWSATRAVSRAQEMPSKIPAAASDSQWAAR